MQVKNIHQFSAGFNSGDAISNEILFLQSHFQKNGFSGNIYSESIGHIDRKICTKYKSYNYKSGDIIIYHHSIHSNVLDFVLKIPCPKFLIYHNVTPHHFFDLYDLRLSYCLKKGREELSEMRSEFLLSFGDSKYNCNELLEHGYFDVYELPIIYDFNKLHKRNQANQNTIKNIIFVGRIAPNKKQDDLLRFAAIYKKYYSNQFLLNIVGFCSKELNLYMDELNTLVDYFQIKDVVHFSNFVDDTTLSEYYQKADLFLSMSEHEGFCVPLIESMHHEIPIIAYNAGAVKDTLDNSGILFYQKDYLVLSELVFKIFSDENFRNKIIHGQNQRLIKFKQNQSAIFLLDKILEKLQ